MSSTPHGRSRSEAARQFTLVRAEDAPFDRLLPEFVRQIEEAPLTAGLGLVYLSDTLAGDVDELLETLRDVRPGIDWVGSVGSALISSGREHYSSPVIVGLLIDWPRSAYGLVRLTGAGVLEPLVAPSPAAGNLRFGLIHADPTDPAVQAAIDGLGRTLPGLFVNGGMTSSASNYLQFANRLHGGGLSGVAVDASVEVVTDHTQGCTPLGGRHLITGARKNMLLTLDGRPALEVMKEQIGEVLARDLKRIAGYVFVGLPIRGSDTGDYMVRNLIGIDPDHGFLAIGDYLEGHEALRFCLRDGNTARRDMERMLERLRRRINGRLVRGGVYISCVGRGRHQFGGDAAEVAMIHRLLGQFPLVGFFANGEIYNGRLYGYTGVLTLFL